MIWVWPSVTDLAPPNGPTRHLGQVGEEVVRRVMLSSNALAWIGMVSGLVAGLVFGFKTAIVIVLVLVGSVAGAIVGFLLDPDQ